MTLRRSGGEWTDLGLVEEFLREFDNPAPGSCWRLSKWQAEAPTDGGLKVSVNSPDREANPSFFHSFLKEITGKLSHGLSLASRERGWPAPRFAVETSPTLHEEWSYRLEVGPYLSETVTIHPNKVLAVGDEEVLSPLLGLECHDPVFGLPAKWVTFGQTERAQKQGALLFESSEVVLGHAINFVRPRMEHAVGIWEVDQWLSESPLEQKPLEQSENQQELPLLTALLKRLLSEGLHLPRTARFLEYVVLARTELAQSDFETLYLMVRREVVQDNIHRWLDQEGLLNAVEWQSPGALKDPDHHRMLNRLIKALEALENELSDGSIVLLTGPEQRAEMTVALKGLFPDLPVLAWSELKETTNVKTLMTVNAELELVPSPMPGQFYSPTVH